MVSDPRVTRSLTRLGGLYRDPSRVDRDASQLLKSSVGAHLTPGIAPLVEYSGEVAHCLVLQGTIAMHFRGNTYQLLVDIYLPPGYPQRPPVAFVRLTENMYLKENHKHVANDGRVFLPYLHEWNMRTHNLVEFVVAMSSVFSADPPVFTRAPTATATPPPPRPTVTASTTNNDPPPPMPSHLMGGSGMDAAAEARLAREAEEANRVMEAARKAEREEQEREQQMAAQKRWEVQKKNQVKEQVLQKVLKHLQETSLETKQQAQNYQRDQQRLNIAEEKLEKQLQLYQEAKNELTDKLSVVQEKTVEIEEWLTTAAQAQNNGTSQKEKTVDELVQPVAKIHQQMLDLSAENASLTDALYFLDRALYLGNLECEAHLKHVRRLAKRQFLARAHLMKINQHLLKNPELASAASF